MKCIHQKAVNIIFILFHLAPFMKNERIYFELQSINSLSNGIYFVNINLIFKVFILNNFIEINLLFGKSFIIIKVGSEGEWFAVIHK
ncbi:hypothetical protein bsdcttw_25320 [Anaerocolumna chitinilytica]|uniref:Uncharacterized protein n=1 Tax=Anaerocolumna chitinilytica TaxID=1727145 RepID=A0A7I8DQE1_9FIRM|nr:hypothetical protein bsdcttw_25320 [Anaerocolumna chitinilytica]